MLTYGASALFLFSQRVAMSLFYLAVRIGICAIDGLRCNKGCTFPSLTFIFPAPGFTLAIRVLFFLLLVFRYLPPSKGVRGRVVISSVIRVFALSGCIVSL